MTRIILGKLKPGMYYGCIVRRDRKPQIFWSNGQWLYTSDHRASRKRSVKARIWCEKMNDRMRPKIWFRSGNWHCARPILDGVTVTWWPRGVGDTPRAAFINYEKRAKEWTPR